MSTTVILGAQFGDEGKARIVDVLAEKADVIVRFNGGGNAGHTLVIGGKKVVLHLCPAGIVREGKINVIGPGVVFDLVIGSQEIDHAREYGATLLLDNSTPIVLPIHRALDAGREAVAGKNKIGTTKRGIGPTYGDFWLRRGLKLGDLRHRALVRETLVHAGYWDELVALCRHMKINRGVDISDLNLDIDPMSLTQTLDWCMRYADQVCEHLADTRAYVHQAVAEDRDVLFEGAQGIMLDGIHGTRPNCTSSTCTAAGVSATFGLFKLDRVLGVAKAYLTRVGSGPFPTELDNEIGQQIRENGDEYGSTTGRPRRCGWLDLPMLRYTCRVGGITELFVTKLDILGGLPELKFANGYHDVDDFKTLTGDVLNNVTPVYEDAQPWEWNIDSVRSLSELHGAPADYLNKIRHGVGVPIAGVSVAAEREAMFWTDDLS